MTHCAPPLGTTGVYATPLYTKVNLPPPPPMYAFLLIIPDELLT